MPNLIINPKVPFFLNKEVNADSHHNLKQHHLENILKCRAGAINLNQYKYYQFFSTSSFQ